MSRALLSIALLTGLSGCAMIDFTDPPPPAAPAHVAVSPLDGLTRLQLPDSVANVHDAVQFLLAPTGYRLVTRCPGCAAEAAEIAAKPISPLASRPQLTTIERALILVAGSRTRLVVDDRAREVSFAYIEVVR